MRHFILSAAAVCLALAASLVLPAASRAAVRGDLAVAAMTPIRFTVVLPLRNEAELETLIDLQSDDRSPLYHHFLTPEQFEARYGPSPAAFDTAARALRARGFVVGNLESQSFEVQGTVAQAERTFGVRVWLETRSRAPHLVVREPLQVPRELSALGATLLRLDALPLPQPNVRVAPHNSRSPEDPFWFTDLKQAYSDASYTVARGKGARVAILSDSDFSSADVKTYLSLEWMGGPYSLAPAPVPEHLVMAGAFPFNPSKIESLDADLGVEQLAGAAPGATVTGASISGNDFYDGFAAMVKKNDFDIIASAYGACELEYTAAYNDGVNLVHVLQVYDDMFKQGNAQGITFVFGSGVQAGLPCPRPGYFGKATGKPFKELAGVDYWADDPHVTAVGGTNLITTSEYGSTESKYVSESENDDTIGLDDPNGTGNYVSNELWGSGGGVSTIWAKPSYQDEFTKVKGRSVPDVAMDMGGCNDSTWRCGSGNVLETSTLWVVFGGGLYVGDGSGASVPAFAGLLAVKVGAGKSRLGEANQYIYKLAAANAKGHYFHQGIPGKNGVVTVVKGALGYNPITGVGSPIDDNFLGLGKFAVAGNPETTSNP